MGREGRGGAGGQGGTGLREGELKVVCLALFILSSHFTVEEGGVLTMEK